MSAPEFHVIFNFVEGDQFVGFESASAGHAMVSGVGVVLVCPVDCVTVAEEGFV